MTLFRHNAASSSYLPPNSTGKEDDYSRICYYTLCGTYSVYYVAKRLLVSLTSSSSPVTHSMSYLLAAARHVTQFIDSMCYLCHGY